MYRIFTLVIFLLCCTFCFAQTNKKFAYLVVEFDSWKDHNKEDTTYFTIKGDMFSSTFKLNNYNNRSNKGNTAAFFFSRTDSKQPLYNDFRSINEALLFLGENGWELVSVNNSIQSESAVHQRLFDKEVPYTKVDAKPVFYLKKLME